MRRRDFLALAGATAAAWPLMARAQQAPVKRLGFIHILAETDPTTPQFVAAMRGGVAAQGWTEGRNLRIDYRLAINTPEKAMTAARELVDLKPDVIMTVGANAAVEVAKLTRTIPIVTYGPDPVGLGLAESYAHPGGNLTGFIASADSTVGKRLELLKELAPGVKRVATLVQPNVPPATDLPLFRSVAAALGMEPIVLTAGSIAEIAAVLAEFAAVPDGGVVYVTDSFINADHATVTAEVARNRLPAVFGTIPFADDGPVTYYFDSYDVFGRAGGYAGLILNGANPGDLPVQSPTKYLLTINLKTAKAMGLTVPSSILLRADQVIE